MEEVARRRSPQHYSSTILRQVRSRRAPGRAQALSDMLVLHPDAHAGVSAGQR